MLCNYNTRQEPIQTEIIHDKNVPIEYFDVVFHETKAKTKAK